MGIEEKLRELEQTVSVIEDKNLREIAFQKLLDVNFSVNENDNKTSEKTLKVPNNEKADLNQSNNVTDAARKLGVQPEDILEKFDIQDSQIRIYELPEESTRTKLQFKCLQMLSILYKYCFDKTEFNVSEVLDKSKITTERIDHLTRASDFRKTFTGNAKKTKLTWKGEQDSKEILKEYLTTDKNA